MKIDTDPRKNELLSHCSPEFQEQVKREQESAARDAKKEEARRLRRKALSDSVKVIAFLFLIGLAFAFLYSGFTSLDRAGWITHNHDTPLWIQGDWLVGEYRECDMQTTTPAYEGSHYDAEDLKTLPRLFCGRAANGFFEWSETKTGTDVSWQTISGDFHTLPVSYFGRLERPDKWRISWRCQRTSNSLTCKALD